MYVLCMYVLCMSIYMYVHIYLCIDRMSVLLTVCLPLCLLVCTELLICIFVALCDVIVFVFYLDVVLLLV